MHINFRINGFTAAASTDVRIFTMPEGVRPLHVSVGYGSGCSSSALSAIILSVTTAGVITYYGAALSNASLWGGVDYYIGA